MAYIWGVDVKNFDKCRMLATYSPVQVVSYKKAHAIQYPLFVDSSAIDVGDRWLKCRQGKLLEGEKLIGESLSLKP